LIPFAAGEEQYFLNSSIIAPHLTDIVLLIESAPSDADSQMRSEVIAYIIDMHWWTAFKIKKRHIIIEKEIVR